MYRKNVAGQFLCVQLILTATGAVGTGLTPAARRCLDGTFGAGGGSFTEDGTTGSYKYALAQADTNANNVSIIVTATGCIPVCVNFLTTAADPTNATTLGLTNLDATVSSRASQTSVDTVDDFLDTEVAAIKAKTDNLPSDPADASDIASAFSTVNTALTTIDDFLDTEIAAIKAKTDSLTFTVAGQLDANIQYVNDVQVNGNGQTGTEWGP